jgi:hypothetical protein
MKKAPLLRAQIGWWLRIWADRLDPENAPRGTSYSFTFEKGKGIVFHEDGRGCPLWYLGEGDYKRAHREARGECDYRLAFSSQGTPRASM